jgi:tripartite-type tricarboxylate transporter receptor subunit TctC
LRERNVAGTIERIWTGTIFSNTIPDSLRTPETAGARTGSQDQQVSQAMDHLSNRRRCAAALLLALGAVSPSQAQDYPRQTVKIIVPFAAGGGVDVVARIIASKLGEELGQSVIIENRAGAGGMIGAAAVAQSPPDGYTILLGTGSTHGTNSSVYAKVSYDPVRDFEPIVLVSQSPLLMVVQPASPANNVTEFIALARSKPGQLSFGSYGTGSINHLGAELFNTMAKIQTNHVPYRGSAPALTDLIGGRLDFVFDGVSTSLGYVRAGTLKLLGVAGPSRSPVLPDSPTIAESGLPGFDTSVWFGLFAPAGTPRTIVDKVNGKMSTVLATPEVKANFANLGFEAVGGGPEVLARRVQAELKKWADLVREKNIHIDQ